MKQNPNRQKPAPCFKRWSRKSYGAFASLHRYVTIGVLSVGMSIILLATSLNDSYAADTLSRGATFRLDSAEIVGNQISPTRSAMSKTMFYNRKTEAAAPFQTLESVLRSSASFDIRERGGKGIQTDISIRGGSFDQTMVMLNGINFTDARTGHQTHSLPIDIESVAGIDLIDGVTGTGAYAGAINFRTQQLYPKYIRAQISGGDHGYIYTNLNGAVTNDNFSLYMAGSYRKSDGYRANTDFSNINAYVRANYQNLSFGFFDIQAGYQTRNFGANGFYSLKYPDQFEHTSTTIASIRWVKNLTGNITINAISSYRKNRDRFELIKGKPETVPYNYHLTDNLGEELWIDYRSLAGITSLGGDYTYNHIYSTVLGETLNSKKNSGFTQTDSQGYKSKIFYTKGKSRDVGNFWIRHNKNFDRVDIAASAGLCATTYCESFIWSISGGYVIMRDKNRGSGYDNIWKLEYGAAQSMRLPTFTDLYYTATGYVGNTNLNPEKAITYKLCSSHVFGKFSSSITGYYRTGRNIIDWVKNIETDNWQSEQTTKLNTFGIEFMSKYVSSTGCLRMASLSYGYVTTDKKAGDKISKYALDYMKNKVSASLQGVFLKNFTVCATGTLFDRYGKYTESDGKIGPYKTYFLLDARISWAYKFLSFYADGSNLTSTRYFDYGGLEMPGIWVSGGVIVTLK